MNGQQNTLVEWCQQIRSMLADYRTWEHYTHGLIHRTKILAPRASAKESVSFTSSYFILCQKQKARDLYEKRSNRYSIVLLSFPYLHRDYGFRLLGEHDPPIQKWWDNIVHQQVDLGLVLLLKVFIYIQLFHHPTCQEPILLPLLVILRREEMLHVDSSDSLFPSLTTFRPSHTRLFSPPPIFHTLLLFLPCLSVSDVQTFS